MFHLVITVRFAKMLLFACVSVFLRFDLRQGQKVILFWKEKQINNVTLPEIFFLFDISSLSS